MAAESADKPASGGLVLKQLEDLTTEIVGLRGEGRAEAVMGLAAKGMALLATLRKKFVAGCYSTEALKVEVDELRTNHEESSLTLENVRYERNYYDRLISANMDFQSAFKDEQIALRPATEFQSSLSAEAQKAIDEAPNREHAIMLERLKAELAERKALKERVEELQASKRQLQSQNDKKKRKLEKLSGSVVTIGQSAANALGDLGLQQLGVTALESNALQSHLPTPLYVLQAQLAAANEVFEHGCKVTISHTGSHGEHKRKRKRASESAVEAPGTADSMYQADAHQVKLEILPERDQAGDAAVLATFCFVPHLNVVTAVAPNAASARLLDALYPNDDGTAWPHDVSQPAHDPEATLEVARLPGKPYRWCQQLAGLDLILPPPDDASLGVTGARHPDFPKLMARYRHERRAAAFLQRIKQRRVELATVKAHLDSLAALRLPATPADASSLLPELPAVTVTSWSVDAATVAARAAPVPATGDGAAQEEDGEVPDAEEGLIADAEGREVPRIDLTDKGALALHVGPQDAGVAIQVEVSTHALYPLVPPLLRVKSIKPAHAPPSAASLLSRAQIAVLEGEINVRAVELLPADPLPLQLAYLCHCGQAALDAQRQSAGSSAVQHIVQGVWTLGRTRLPAPRMPG